jgi:Acyl-protein synthetase, LuxE
MSIYEKVLAFIERPDCREFQGLALEVFRYQFESVAPYRKFCLSVGAHPDSAHGVDDIPPVSTLAFKYARLEDTAEAVRSGAALDFFTSGTTVGLEGRGRHRVPRPEVYRLSAVTHIRRMLFLDGLRMRLLALHPTADRMPESSLAWMITWCLEEFGAEPSMSVADHRRLDLDAATRFLALAERDRVPVGLLGTTASFAALFEYLEAKGARFGLARGSRMMDTGGAKGQVMPLAPEAVRDRALQLLNIPPALAINEYGMTELCSQLYDATEFNSTAREVPAGERIKIAPPWLWSAAVDPASLRTVAPGEVGMLRFFDLANVGSVAAILTDDFGTVENGRVRLLGRTEGAPARGCALAIEQFEAAELERRGGGSPIRSTGA